MDADTKDYVWQCLIRYGRFTTLDDSVMAEDWHGVEKTLGPFGYTLVRMGGERWHSMKDMEGN